MITEAVTYTQYANHIVTAVSELPEYFSKNRNISGVTFKQDTSGASSGIHKPDGSINTGHIPNWRNLPQADRDKVFAERKRLGLSKGKPSAGKGAHRSNNAKGNRLKYLTDQNKKYKLQIKAFKRSSDGSANDDNNTSGDTDAGDQFGGKASNRTKKET